jgi:hypothetical protein
VLHGDSPVLLYLRPAFFADDAVAEAVCNSIEYPERGSRLLSKRSLYADSDRICDGVQNLAHAGIGFHRLHDVDRFRAHARVLVVEQASSTASRTRVSSAT